VHIADSPSAESGDRGPAERPQAPGVTAVVVTHRPGDWFEECLVSLRGQDYTRLRVLVLDTTDASATMDERVHGVLLDAEVRSVDGRAGFGSSINSSKGDWPTPFLLLCHDDVALAPDAVRRLVEEAIRSNAGIVGPKFVDWDNPSIVRQVGLGADKTGAPVDSVEPDELDQEQHDAVRDVFMTSSACMLVRSDLFDALDGFDEAISFRGEDLDLCWRAHVAGARVLVAPAAVVRHRADLESRRPGDDPLRLRRRHQVRAMLANYSRFHLVRVVPQAIIVTAVELVFALLTARIQRARSVLAAWSWNLRRLPSLFRRRKSLASVRAVSDSEVRRIQAAGFAPIATYFRSRRDGDHGGQGGARGRQMIEAVRSGSARSAAITWALVVLLYLFGVRHLITRGIPIYGEMTSFGGGARDALGEWWSGWRDEGLGRDAPSPIGPFFVSVGGFVFLGRMALLRTVVVLALPLLGGRGIWKALGPFGSDRARIVGLVAYLANPLAYNAIANGSLSALALFAGAPWLLVAIGRASQQSPYGLFDGGRGPGVPVPSVVRETLTLGLLLGVMTAFAPPALLIMAVMVVAVFVGSLLSGHVLGSGRLLAVVFAGSIVALALQLPSALDALDREWALLAGIRSDGATGDRLADLARFETGPVGGDLLGWALIAAALLPLVLARGPRFGWAVRGWVMYLGSIAVAMVAAQGVLPVGLPRPEVLLVPGAVGLALATAMGMAAFETDLLRYRFGWRQLVPITAFLALVVATLPVFVATFDGRFEAPRRDFAQVLANAAADDGPGVSRVLWLGDPDVVPTAGWEYEDGVVYALSESFDTTILDRWTGSSTNDTRLVAEALDLGFSKATSRLGSLLGPMGIRYIVVPERLAPTPHGSLLRPAPSGLTAMLGDQLDLERVELNPGVVVYRNAAWVPVRSSVPVGTTTAGTTSFQDAVIVAFDDVVPTFVEGRTSSTAVVADGREVYVAAGGDGWEVTVDGRRSLETKAFGWAQAFSIDAPSGPATAKLGYATPFAVRFLVLAQLLGWLVVAALAARLVSLDREGA
jgi:GT2 family glycosyltransferase